VYVPFAQGGGGTATFEVAVSGSASEVVTGIRQQVESKLPSVTFEIDTLTHQVDRALGRERMMAALTGTFGLLALVLAAVGVYGLLAYTVERRTKEIGVRSALGATPRDVMGMVMQDALRLLMAGVALALPAVWMASAAVRSMLYGLTGTDPSTIGLATAGLVLSGLVAAYLPARRAATVESLVALRHE
jgi:ABC-type antimicrobial peptide transport system permease subunit